jgi:hypothetical protein
VPGSAEAAGVKLVTVKESAEALTQERSKKASHSKMTNGFPLTPDLEIIILATQLVIFRLGRG